MGGLPPIDAKLVVIAVLIAALALAKYLAGGKPWDRPARRKRRFGRHGTRSPLRRGGEAGAGPEEPPPDPEREFFGDGRDPHQR